MPIPSGAKPLLRMHPPAPRGGAYSIRGGLLAEALSPGAFLLSLLQRQQPIAG